MNGGSEKAAFLREAEAMYEELRAWRESHPRRMRPRSFDEIANQVTPQRRKLMGVLLNQLSVQHGDGRYAEATCPTCGERMEASGQRDRQVAHPEGEVELERAYHRCPECGSGLFPPGRTTSSRES
jgi:YgiT-type zinc finger domain-containing protein